MDDYRAPTPTTVASGVVLETDVAHELWRSGNAVWIDVLPAPRRPPNLPAPTLWMPLPRYDISGSLGCPMSVAVRSAPNSNATFEITSRWPLRVVAKPGGVLLFRRLLDGLERNKAGGQLGLYAPILVPGRYRRLGSGKTAGGGSRTGPGLLTAKERA